MLPPFAHSVVCCCVFFGVVAERLKPVKLCANNSQHFFCSVIAEAQRNNVGSVCIAPLSLLGPGTRVKHGLLRDRKSYRLYPSHNALQVPTLLSQHCFELLRPFGHHCRQERNNFQRCFELLHPLAHHCQHGRNNFQHCCRNNGLRNTNRLSLLFLGESKRR